MVPSLHSVGGHAAAPPPGLLLHAQTAICHRRSPAQEIYATLLLEVAKLGLSLRDIAERCLDLSVQWTFPIALVFHPSTLRQHIDVLTPTSERLFAPTSQPHAHEPGTSGVDPAQLETLRAFTLLTAICSKVCAQAPRGLLDYGSALVQPFLTASRQTLATFEDYDVIRPDSRSLTIRGAQAATLHSLGQSRLSRYVLGQAFRLAVDMRLSDATSYAHLDSQEAQLRKNSYWVLYTSDKSSGMLASTTAMLHESPPRPTTKDSDVTEEIEDSESSVLLLGDFNYPFYDEPFERQLVKGISLARKVWFLGSDMSRNMNLLFQSTGDPRNPLTASSFFRHVSRKHHKFLLDLL